VRVVHGFEQLGPPATRSVLTIGNFDGVHRGHQHILGTARRFAGQVGLPLVALTFEPHPLTIVAPARAPRRLTTPEEKIHQLGAAGADTVVVARSAPALLSLEAETFAREYLIRLFHPARIVVGADFGFGRGRRGNVDTLRRMAPECGYDLVVADPFYLEIGGRREIVSSSLVRNLLLAGEVEAAAQCLGRPYALTGTVERGDARGAQLGFPTANLACDDLLVPGDGVYAGKGWVQTGSYRAAISIGSNPTFEGNRTRVEAHLLGFSGDLYGQRMRLEFQRFLRGQQKFASVPDLVEQISRDVDDVRRNL
jgi:riboflavin kinase/FMN adenylyltransferase